MRSLIAALALTILPASNATAAIRVCGKPAVSDITRSRSQILAHRMAIESWRRKVGRLGPRYTNWRLATDKRYQCSRLETDEFACVVFARPCTIRQNPRPPGKLRPPLPRPLPQTRPSEKLRDI